MRTAIPVDRHTAEIEELLHSITTVARRQSREVMADLEVTPPQFDALCALREFGNLAMGELCQKLGTACSTATDLIDRMERNGYVERVRDTNDRRVIRLKITPKGHEVVENVLAASRAQLAVQLEPMDVSDQERLIQSLEQLLYLLRQQG